MPRLKRLKGEVEERERAALRSFVKSASWALTGDVLDFGCGRQPYRDVVAAAGGRYSGFDRPFFPDAHTDRPVGSDDPLRLGWDAILCTQVISLVDHPAVTLQEMAAAVAGGRGMLVITWPLGFRQFHPADRWRFTASGMRTMLALAGFEVETLVATWTPVDGFGPAGYGAIAHARPPLDVLGLP